LSGEYQRQEEVARAEVMNYLRANKLRFRDPKAQEYIREYRKTHPLPELDVKDVADHIDHAVKLVGIQHVGFGSDFDGVGDSLPVGLKDVSGYPNLIHELLSRGYSDADLQKICSGNLLRVWSQVERIASDRQSK
jgi:membrane dipeptidase